MIEENSHKNNGTISLSDLKPHAYDATKSVDFLSAIDNHGIAVGQHRALLETLGANSPYLSAIARKNPDFLSNCLKALSAKHVDQFLNDCHPRCFNFASATEAAVFLRQQKARLALMLGIGDITGNLPLLTITSALSQFADLALHTLLSYLVMDRIKRGDLLWANVDDLTVGPQLAEQCGISILALGKLGGYELNYSSDVDLIVLYDPDRVPLSGKRSIGDLCVRITRDLVRLMQDPSADGYIFRMDLRLRPDPGSTPIALSILAAENYYQTIGQTWERSAYIKARPCAGDNSVGKMFLSRMVPFVWRKNIDFSALEDIQKVKSKVHAFHHHGDFSLAGHDVKLGRGGIREIEFFAQMHQLIMGGRDYDLRTISTLDTLSVLKSKGIIERETYDTLKSAYHYLRELEHRIQMTNDEQSHHVPTADEDVERLSAFMGYQSIKDFDNHLSAVTHSVSSLYDQLLQERGMKADHGDDTVTIETLQALGYQAPERCIETLDRWHSGKYRALRTPRARSFLDKCLPTLLEAFSKSSAPDNSLSQFDKFISKLPQGVQIFSMFQANPWLFNVIARIMSLSPRLADHLGRKPQLFDSVLDTGFFSALPDEEALSYNLGLMLKRTQSYEDVLDQCRRWVHDLQFNIGVQMIEGLITTRAANHKFTEIAEVALRHLLPITKQNYEARYGTFDEGELAIIAMGSFGGRSLTFTSDLDLIMLYDAPQDKTSSKGHSPSQYFSRLGQHIITAITSLTAEGQLYDIDMRLRPSGRKGPLVVTLDTFSKYQREDAWAFEHMALTRARVFDASPTFKDKIKAVIQDILAQPRDADVLKADIVSMRQKVLEQFPPKDIWSVRYIRGGLIDAEYIVQGLILAYGTKRHAATRVGITDGIAELATLGAITHEDAAALKQAAHLFARVMNIMRLCYSSASSDRDFSAELIELLCKVTQQTDIEALTKQLETSQAIVYAFFKKHIGLLEGEDI